MRKLFFFLFLMRAGVSSPAQTNEYETDLAGAQNVKEKASALGSYRGVFTLRPGVEAPFNFDIRKNANGNPELYFRNADECFEGGPVTQKGDSLFVKLDQFDNELAFRIDNKNLTGILRRQDGKGQGLPLTATRDALYRFRETDRPPVNNITGTYAITFSSPNGKEEHSVGIFKQDGSRLTATFLHVTGDSRYLEGIVEADSFRLSSFIGSGPGLYVGHIESDGRITGQNIGARGSQPFTGIKDDKAALPDAYTLTALKDKNEKFGFSFPDADGRIISLKDEKYRNKVVIVTIGGTWCPNCIDETNFLAPWYAANKQRGIEVISIQYERQTDTAFVHKALTRMRNMYNITYDQVLGGIADKQVVAASLPALNTFLAFPTTIFIDRQGRVDKIHTGFNGPATGQYYDDFKQEFNEEVNKLAKQD